jgi:hypothetical protein
LFGEGSLLIYVEGDSAVFGSSGQYSSRGGKYSLSAQDEA